MNLAAVSRSLDITFVRPAFLGDRVVVETEMTTFSRTTAVVRAVMRVPDEEEGADAEGRGRGKVIAIAKHDVSSLARMAAAFAKL